MSIKKPEVVSVYRTDTGGVDKMTHLSDYEALMAECEKLREDAERYRYIKKGNQWIIAATQTGFQIDGEELDDLIDSEMEQQK